MLDSVQESARDSALFWMASAYVHEAAGSPLSAVLDYDAALVRSPGDERAMKARTLALQALMQSGDLSLD